MLFFSKTVYFCRSDGINRLHIIQFNKQYSLFDRKQLSSSVTDPAYLLTTVLACPVIAPSLSHAHS